MDRWTTAALLYTQLHAEAAVGDRMELERHLVMSVWYFTGELLLELLL